MTINNKPKAQLDLTLIICTYKRASSLLVTLTALETQLPEGFSWELIVVDNADDRATQQAVEKFKDKLPVKLIIEKKAGQNSARNAAIPYINGELVVFTDDDITAKDNWLLSLYNASQEYPDVSVFGGKIIPVWGEEKTPWQADAWFSSFVYADQDLGDEQINYVEGCYPSSPNMAIRKEVFDGGIWFNPKIGPIGNNRISGSESEFLSRVLAKRKGLYIPSSQVLHRITPNMLERGYLRKRCYTMGLGMSVWDASPVNEIHLPRLFGIPRYRIGRMLKAMMKTVMFQIFFNQQKIVEEECRAALDLGFCMGIWKNLKDTI
jgi:glycosyltransferase involved in cell wall biosynthesis